MQKYRLEAQGVQLSPVLRAFGWVFGPLACRLLGVFSRTASMNPSRATRALLLVVVALGACGPVADDLFCADDGCEWSDRQRRLLATLSPLPPAPPDPSNRYAQDERAAAIGQKFFFDPAFSGVSRRRDALGRPSTLDRAPEGQPIGISCASCHELGRAGVDVTSAPGHVSVGAGVTDVNALPVVNAVYQNILFWNGRIDSLWALNVVVAESPTTMNGNRLRTAHILERRYGDEVDLVFGSLKEVWPGWRARVRLLPTDGLPGSPAYDALADSDKDLVTLLLVFWSKAIAAYEQHLVSRSSPFDCFVAEDRCAPSLPKLEPAARRGARLFVGKAGCIDCHNGPLFSDGEFHNIGVGQVGAGVPTLADCPAGGACDCVTTVEKITGKNCLPFGAYHGLGRLKASRWLRTGAFSDDMNDLSRQRYSRRALTDDLKGAWRTPSLRDVAQTAPYMHNGSYRTLEEVLWHYNTGGLAVAATAVGTRSVKIKPLGLSQGEIADIIAFLNGLTGEALPARLVTPPPLPPGAP